MPKHRRKAKLKEEQLEIALKWADFRKERTREAARRYYLQDWNETAIVDEFGFNHAAEFRRIVDRIEDFRMDVLSFISHEKG